MFYSSDITRFEDIMYEIKELVAEGRKITFSYSEEEGRYADDTWVPCISGAVVVMEITLDALKQLRRSSG